jgi:hypothetical protein
MTEDLLFYSLTIAFLGFAAGLLLRGGLTAIERAKIYAEGFAEGVFVVTEPDAERERTPGLRRVK